MTVCLLKPRGIWLEWHGPGQRNLAKLMDEAGINLEASCGGRGKCGKCRVQVLEGDCLPPGADERRLLSPGELDEGIRLACCCSVAGRVQVLMDQESGPARILEKSLIPDLRHDPAIGKKLFCLPGENHRESLSMSVLKQLGLPPDKKFPLKALRFFGEYRSGIHTAIMKDDEVLGIEQNDTTTACYGMAVDIGTTTVAAGLFDLATGREVASASALNPQKKYGLDVLTRIQFTQNNGTGLEILQKEITGCLNQLVIELCGYANISRNHIYEVSVAGNTVMMHLFTGVNPRVLGRTPYRSVFLSAQEMDAGNLDLEVSPFARVYCLPSVSSYIGADITAGILTVGLDRVKETTLFLDMGTNGEIVLNKDGTMVSCATALGPALEGMNISCGMRAAEGAVEEVQINKNVKYRTIGGVSPVGLCGSGLLDLVSQLIKAGVISHSGRIMSRGKYMETHPSSILSDHITEVDGKRKFYLEAPDKTYFTPIYMTQADVRQVQLAKAAIVVGIQTLLEKTGIDREAVERVCLAGAFGTYVKPQSLIDLGFFPDIWSNRIVFMGNSSRAGAAMALLSVSERDRLDQIARKVEYFELSTCTDFERIFVENMHFSSY